MEIVKLNLIRLEPCMRSPSNSTLTFIIASSLSVPQHRYIIRIHKLLLVSACAHACACICTAYVCICVCTCAARGLEGERGELLPECKAVKINGSVGCREWR